MEKPAKHKRRPIYDWDECCQYVQDKYNLSIDDYYGHFGWKRYVEATGDHKPPAAGARSKEGRSWSYKLSLTDTAPEYSSDKIERFYVSGLENPTKEDAIAASLIEEAWYQRRNEWEATNPVPYCNFWHWLDVQSRGEYTFERNGWEEIEELWAKDIYGKFLDEFEDENGEFVVNMD